MAKLNRRDFIKITSAGVGGMALGTGAMGSAADLLFSDVAQARQGDVIVKTPTVCDVCFWQCAGWAYTKNGKPWKIIGNENDPHSRGRMCTRGSGGWGAYLDPDRLKKPLLRVGERGKQRFEEVSWDKALDYVAEKMLLIKEKYGPESMALFYHGGAGHYFKGLLGAYGSGNHTAPSYAQCRGPRASAWIATYGAGVLSPECTDLRNTKCLVLIGSHIGENLHNNQVSGFGEAIDKGATIIVVDPRFSVAASKAQYYLPIKPATDLALILAWINVLIEKEWYDKAFVEQYTHGFEELKAHVAQMTPEWAAKITDIPAQVIIETAKEMSQAAPSVIVHPGRHVTWYGDDTQRTRAIAILNALLGSWWRKGGFYKGERVKVPEVPGPKPPRPKSNWRELLDGKYALANTSLSSGICFATIPGDREFNFKGWLVCATNLIKTLPDIPQTMEAIQNLELLAVVDSMPMEITGWADVVLPECTYLERYDCLRASPHREPNVALRMPALEPLYDSKPASWIANRLAHKLGVGKYEPHEDIEQGIEWQLKELGTSLAEMKKIGVKKFPRKRPLYPLEDLPEKKFKTPTKKIELFSTKCEEYGFDPLPKYTAHEEPPDKYYRLLYGRAPAHTFSKTTNNPKLTELMPENSLWVNTQVAREWGIKNGQRVKLENQDGAKSTFSIKVQVTERIRPDVVYMVHGFGHTQKQMRRSYGRGACDNELITKIKYDPLMGGTGMRGNFVTFLLDA